MQYLREGAVISIVYWVSTYLTFNNDYVSTLDSSSCGANTETFITLQPSSVYYKLRDTQINLYKQKLDVTPPRMTFCPSLWQTEPTSEKTHRERERTNKRCARTLAKTQTTAVKLKGLRGLNLAERPQRQSLARCTVSSVWHRAWTLLYQRPVWTVCQSSCSEALPYLLSKQASPRQHENSD